MKRIILGCLALSAIIISCNPKEDAKAGTGPTATTSTVALPYVASYTTDFTNNVSDSDLLVALNSYKYWENGDMAALKGTMGDSVEVYGSDGSIYKGGVDSLMRRWKLSRDSMSSVAITMEVWLKNHSVKDSMDYINVWYKEIDTYKTGKVDSAKYEDDNGMKNGKVVWFSSHKQKLK